MKRSSNITISIGIIVTGILLLGIDRIFVSASTGNFTETVSIVTTIAIFIVLIGVIWLFKSSLR